MYKKLLVLAVFALLLSSCGNNFYNKNSTYEEVSELAFSTKTYKNNNSNIGYTFHTPPNANIITKTQHSTVIDIGRYNYTLSVNTNKFLEVYNIIIKTDNGDYILNSGNNVNINSASSYDSDPDDYSLRTIFIEKNPSLSEVESKSYAQGILNDILEEKEFDLEVFKQYQRNYNSNGSETSPLDLNIDIYNEISKLDVGEVVPHLIENEKGYYIIYFESTKTLESDKDLELNATNLVFEYYHDNYSLIISNVSDDYFSIVVANSYASANTTVKKKAINEAIFNTINLVKSVDINNYIALNSIVSPTSLTAAESINLNANNDSVVKKITNEYQYVFSTSFDDSLGTESGFKSEGFKFDTITISEAQYEAIVNPAPAETVPVEESTEGETEAETQTEGTE